MLTSANGASKDSRTPPRKYASGRSVVVRIRNESTLTDESNMLATPRGRTRQGDAEADYPNSAERLLEPYEHLHLRVLGRLALDVHDAHPLGRFQQQVIVTEADELAPALRHHHLVLRRRGLGPGRVRMAGPEQRGQPRPRCQHDEREGDDGEDGLRVAIEGHARSSYFVSPTHSSPSSPSFARVG